MTVVADAPVSVAVEGAVDEAVALKLIDHVGGTCSTVYGKKGKPWLKARCAGYNSAGRYSPWFVLVDLDGQECAPQLIADWIPTRSAYLCFRVVVREIEAWLLADDEALADYFGISRARIPRAPELLIDPKREMVKLALASRRGPIRSDMVPRQGSGRTVGPAYSSRLTEFVRSAWRPAIASNRAHSLGRALFGLQRLVQARNSTEKS